MAKRGTARKRPPLSRARIADAAMDLIDREGLDSLSFRKLAADLGCEAMSLYHHFPSKAHLVDALIDRCIAAAEVPPTDLPWAEQMRGALRGYRRMALKHPRIAPILLVHRLNTPIGVAYLDKIARIFRAGGFDDETAARFFRDTSYFLMGAVLDECMGYAKGPSAAEPVADDFVRRECPNLTAMAPFFKPAHFEATFETGIDILIAGFESRRR